MQEHDRLTPLGQVAAPEADSFVDGPFGSNLKTTEYTASGVRLVQLQNIGDGAWIDENKRYISPRKFRSLLRHGAKPGDIAIAKMAEPVARACLLPSVDEQFVVVADCIKLSPDSRRYDAKYLVHAINSHPTRKEAEKKSTGTTRLRINLSVLKTVRVWAPDLLEQQRIAEILDTLDEAIRKTEGVIAKLRQMKQGLLHDLLTRGLDDNGELRDPDRHPEQFHMTPLGRLPKGWEVDRLQDLTVAPICYGIVQAGKFVDDGVQVLMIRDLNGDFRTGLHRTAAHIDAAYSRSRVQAGDVLLSIKGTMGRLGVVPEHFSGNISRDLARLRFNRRVSPKFAYHYFLSSLGLARLALAVVGSTRAEVSIHVLKRLAMPTPSVEEQQLIVAHLDQCDARLRTEIAGLGKLRALKSGLMDDLLTGRVRVTKLIEKAA